LNKRKERRGRSFNVQVKEQNSKNNVFEKNNSSPRIKWLSAKKNILIRRF
jgi:hypothetical protein